MKKILLLIFLTLCLYGESYDGNIINANCEKVIKGEFNICYSISHKGANFVEYTLSDKSYKYKRVSFKIDKRLEKSEQGNNKVYYKAGYDKGHILSRESASWSKQNEINSFLYSNIVPQRPYLNRQVWRMLELVEQNFAKKFKKVNVISGVLYSNNKLKNYLYLPSYFYKIINIPSLNKTICYLLPAEYNYTTKYEAMLFRISSNELIKIIDSNSNVNMVRKW
jgi:DNA/RNA endonuclease G (NUC1)